MKGKEYFISGIDTDCGKTYITGKLAYLLKQKGVKIITTKLIQTGCKGVSEDILEHRRIMKSEILVEDKNGLTCPFVFKEPASPHLAAKIENKIIDLNVVKKTNEQLLQKYKIVLTEGAGGLMVPIIDSYKIIDYINDNNLPLILISSSKLGSINHTLMSLEICKLYNINLHSVIYNLLPNSNKTIAKDSYLVFQNYINENFTGVNLIHSNNLEDFVIIMVNPNYS